MPNIGDIVTLDHMISRARFDDAYITLRHIDYVLTAVYRGAGSTVVELWMDVSDEEEHVMRFIAIFDQLAD